MRKLTFLISMGLMALSGANAWGQTFEELPIKPYVNFTPCKAADVNGDGKLEIFAEVEGGNNVWQTLTGGTLFTIGNAGNMDVQYVNAQPVPGLVRNLSKVDSYASCHDAYIMRGGKYEYVDALLGMEQQGSTLKGVAWADFNLDGRADLLYWRRTGGLNVPYVMMQRADGTFVNRPFEVVTDMDELQGAMGATGGNGTFTMSTGNAFSAFASGKTPGIPVGPVTVIDFNQDGYPDIIDSKGSSFISLPDGRYYHASIAGQKVRAGDVTGNGLTDLLVYDGQQLILKLNTGRDFQDVSLLSNTSVQDVFMLDCDGDGQLDVLAALSTDDASYLAFFRNQGDGTFKRTVRSFTGKVEWMEPCFVNNNGRPSMISKSEGQYVCWNWDASFRVDTVVLNADQSYKYYTPIADFDGDGKVDLLCGQGGSPYSPGSDQYGLWHCQIEKANTAPARMKAPRLLLDKSTGMLRAEWEHGSDAENSVGDLSYEFEITSPSGDYLFRAFTKSLFSLASAGSWGTGSVLARVRCIDGSGMKGEWSEAAQQDGILAVPSVSLDYAREASTGDTIFVTELAGIECELRGLPDGRMVTAQDGRKGFLFDTPGIKTVEAAAPGGMSVSKQVELLPLRMEEFYLPGFYDGNDVPSALYFDYAQTGEMQAVNRYGYFVWNGHKYDKQPAFGFSDGGMYVYGGCILDANMDGLPDVAGNGSSTNTGCTLTLAINQGDGDFEKQKVSYTFSAAGRNFCGPVDVNNDGLAEYFYSDADDYSANIYTLGADGSTKRIDMDFGDYDGKVSGLTVYYRCCADFDRDGRIDVPVIFTTGSGTTLTAILFNEGNGRWTVKPVNCNFDDCVPFDVDGDGYVDIVYNNEMRFLHRVLRNLGNREFASDMEEAMGVLVRQDLDQDGQADYQMTGRSIMVSNNGMPIVVPNEKEIYVSERDFSDANNDGIPDCLSSKSYTYWADALLRTANTNTAPTAPISLIATQTADEVIVSWDGATDQESTASQLRYNISIKEKGATGENAYVWSPLNATSNGARMNNVLGYPTYYRQATTLPMPVSRFQAGKTYEICVQTIDPWYACSPFSQVIEFTPQAECHLVLPAKAGVGEYVPYRTVSNVQGAVAISPADGMDLSKDGYIKWNTPGVKTVVTTNADTQKQSTTQILIVDRPNLDVQWPDVALAGQTLVLNMPECMRSEGAKVSVTAEGASVAYEAGSNQAVLTIPEQNGNVVLTISYADNVWQTPITRVHTINVMGQRWTPQIAQVAVSGGHNIISWGDQHLPVPSFFTGMVNIYRESNVADSYELIAQVPLSQGEYVDEQSKADVQSYRYQMTLSTVNGVESMPSQVHACMHMMANLGLGNDINLHWTPYEGTDVAQYVVYAGTTPENMQVVERLSGYARSYVHHRTDNAVTYYAVGFVPKSASTTKAKVQARDVVTSNVISSVEAYGVRAVESIEIATLEDDATFTQERTTLHLQAYITPAQASIGKVEWSVVSGESFASISDNGVLRVKQGCQGGDVVVQAKAIDGSGVTATRTFYVPLEAGVKDVTSGTNGVMINVVQSGVALSGVTHDTDVLVTTIGGTVVHRSTITADHRISLQAGTYVIRAGRSVKKVIIR